MDQATKTKIIIGAVVMIVWGALVLMNRTDVAGYVQALKEILQLLGLYHIVTVNKGKP